MHHTDALAQQSNDETVHEVREEARVGKMAESERPEVTLLQTGGRESEVVHVLVLGVRRPHQERRVEECVESDHGQTNISTWQKRTQFLYLSLEAVTEVSLGSHA